MPKRYLIVLLLFFCAAYINLTINNLHKVMNMLVKRAHPNITSTKNSTTLCGTNETTKIDDISFVEESYGWTKDVITNSGTTEYGGYAIGHLIGGYISDKYGSKHVITISVASLSFMNLSWPLFMNWCSGNAIVLYGLIFSMGVCMGCLYPAICSALSHWVPYREYGRLCCFTFTGILVGTLMDELITIRLVTNTTNWRSPFYLYGGIGVGISMLWLILGTSSPQNYSDMSSEEDLYLRIQLGDTVDHNEKEVPLKRILTSKEVWFLTAGNFGHLWYRMVIGYFKTKFIKDILEANPNDFYWGPMPSIAKILTAIASGIFTDYAVSRNLVDAIVLKHIFTNIGLMGPSIYLVAMAFAPCHEKLGQVLLYTSMILGGPIYSSLRLIPLELSPNYSGTIAAISHGIGITSGSLIAVVHDSGAERDLSNYRSIFFKMLAASAVSNIIFILGRYNLKEWNTPPKRPRKRIKNK